MLPYLVLTVLVLSAGCGSLILYCLRLRDKLYKLLKNRKEFYNEHKKANIKLLQEINFLKGTQNLKATVKQGRGGRWRWEVYNINITGKIFVAGSPPHGYNTRQEAVAAVVSLFPGRIDKGI